MDRNKNWQNPGWKEVNISKLILGSITGQSTSTELSYRKLTTASNRTVRNFLQVFKKYKQFAYCV